jgi:hypothetical protein
MATKSAHMFTSLRDFESESGHRHGPGHAVLRAARAKTASLLTRRRFRLSFQQTPKRRPRAKTKRLSIQWNSEWHSACNRPGVALENNERDLKNRKRFGWTDDDAKADWPHAAGAYRRIESSNKGRRDKRHARLERSQSGRPGCHSLPRNMSNGRNFPRPLFSLHK